jgi:hypothetical protein
MLTGDVQASSSLLALRPKRWPSLEQPSQWLAAKLRRIRQVRPACRRGRDLASGSLDAALTSADNLFAWRNQAAAGVTHDIRMVQAVDRGLGLGLYLRPGLSDPGQLRGRRVGVDVPDSGFAFAL